MYDEIMLAVNGAKATLVDPVSLSEHGLHERAHLQEWVLAHPEILGAGVEVIVSEYDRWQTAGGSPVGDRLDVLGVDRSGRLVVAELKRGAAPHTVHMQAVNYAAMVSRLTPRDVAEMYAETRTQSGTPLDADSALALLETERLLTAESIRRPRIVLIASQFPPSVTAAVVWLNEQGVEISLVRFRPYAVDDGRVVVSFSRFFPVPDVEEFTIGRRVAVEEDGPDELGPPWDYPSLARLAESGNQATLTMLDLCAVEDAGAVTVRDIAEHAALKDGQIRGQLAGLTMRLRNQKHGFAQKRWPVTVKYLPGGVASYTMGPELAKSWRTIRQLNPSS